MKAGSDDCRMFQHIGRGEVCLYIYLYANKINIVMMERQLKSDNKDKLWSTKGRIRDLLEILNLET